ncbi:MAG: nuclear transport factor 2 family protein [Pseudomonadota bacterium]
MASVKELAEMTVEYNNTGRSRELLDQIYADTVQSNEAGPMPDGSAGVTGIEALKGKWDWWESANEVHSSKAEGPYYHGDDRFSVIYEIDVTDKASGERVQMREVAVYTAADGKIVKEEFYYNM